MAAKPTVLVTRKLPPAVEVRLARDYEARLNEADRPYDRDEILAGAEGADALLVTPTEQIDAELSKRLPRSVRIIASFSVGHEHIDVAAATARGITVTNTPEVLTDATADVAMLLLLGTARRASEGEAVMRQNAWARWSTVYMLGTQVTGKRLGIVGFGRIGRALAKRARGFDMEIHYHDIQRAPAEIEEGARFHADVETMLPISDFLSLNCPATAETRDLINERTIALLPDGAIVVNTSRGDVIDDEALIAALRSGKLGGAGLDVYQNEPNVNPAYRTLRNTFLLPHLGSASHETRDAMGFRALDNLDAFFGGQRPRDALA